MSPFDNDKKSKKPNVIAIATSALFRMFLNKRAKFLSENEKIQKFAHILLAMRLPFYHLTGVISAAT